MTRCFEGVSMSEAPAIPMTILTGFLGAGKTTVLNRLLREAHGRKIAVLVNDFGAINIDAQLVVGIERNDIVNLANGCICCTIREDLLTATLALLDRAERPDAIIVEASGISDPLAIAWTFRSPALRPHITLDAIVAVVDAERIYEQREQVMQVVDQIAAADMVVINKIDLVPPLHIHAVMTWIQSIVPRARIVAAEYGDVPVQVLLGSGIYRIALLPNQEVPEPHTHHHDHEWQTWHYQTTQPFHLRRLQHALHHLPPSIFRAKGIVALAEAPDRQAIVQVVGNRASVQLSTPWGLTSPYSQLVVIGQRKRFDVVALRQQFHACLASGDHELCDQRPSANAWSHPDQAP
ncbi:cobalamin synthesis protein P47K [Herpetosiphon aurantiacus DSM 785]|uniref:Cobalamin synthesis protein P47K n=1 Tax=Herpetosiphon aurantiacus (strain ATCC 23779 / DSM 785 / 114-95) TaxID=316274 RepID=A9AW64_HERA2|nr:cobalamin synthesis protein P47K [Herpetosiphon aurantiacus DSM 785]